MSLSSQQPPLLRSVEVANFEALLERLSAQLAATAHIVDESGAFPTIISNCCTRTVWWH